MGRFNCFFFSLLSFLSLALVLLSAITPPKAAVALPLSTDTRWIVDEGGRRVKLACVNWVSHLDAVVAEGLSKQPVDAISKRIAAMGFNCVRLTWPLFLATNDTLAKLTVRQSFWSLGLLESIAGFQVNNPSIIDLTLIRAYQAVVESLGDNNVMVIMDNHISKPGWCCSKSDGNGFFGDQYFNPDLWVKGLTRMATLFKGTPNVVAMSLRNELHGHKQNIKDWYRAKSTRSRQTTQSNFPPINRQMGWASQQNLVLFVATPIQNGRPSQIPKCTSHPSSTAATLPCAWMWTPAAILSSRILANA